MTKSTIETDLKLNTGKAVTDAKALAETVAKWQKSVDGVTESYKVILGLQKRLAQGAPSAALGTAQLKGQAVSRGGTTAGLELKRQLDINRAQRDYNKLAESEVRLRTLIAIKTKDRSAAETRELKILQKQQEILQRENQLLAQGTKITAQQAAGLDRRRKNLAMLNVIHKQISATEKASLRANTKLAAEKEASQKRINALLHQEADLTKAQGVRAREARKESLLGDGGRGLLNIQAHLLAHYTLINKVTSAFSFLTSNVVELDKQFYNLQAITRTTDTEMVKLKASLQGVSEKTKFTILEVAEAATIMGQAGFSTTEIEQSIEAVTLLATATGSDLTRAVDITTSVLTVFRLQASETVNVVNTMTAAINNSKLSLEKIALGVQYSSNLAAQAGVQFDELTAALGAMADAGIRSGSTLGTGMRQLIIELGKPTEKFQARLDLLGISLEDVNIKTHGLLGAFRNLTEGGFTASDAMQVFKIRSAAAAGALLNNLAGAEKLNEQILFTNAATKANETQMKSLSNTWAKFQSVAVTVAANMSVGVVSSFQIVTDALANTFKELNKFGPTLRLVGDGLALIVGGTALKWLTGLALGMTTATVRASTMGTVLGAVSMKAQVFGWRIAAATTSLKGFGILARSLTRTLAPFIALEAIMWALSDSADTIKDSIDTATAAVDESRGKLESYGQTVESINTAINRLAERSKSLTENEKDLSNEQLKLIDQFTGMADILNNQTIKGVEGLIEALRKLREEASKKIALELSIEGTTLAEKLKTERERLEQQSGKARSRVMAVSYRADFDALVPGLSDALKLLRSKDVGKIAGETESGVVAGVAAVDLVRTTLAKIEAGTLTGGTKQETLFIKNLGESLKKILPDYNAIEGAIRSVKSTERLIASNKEIQDANLRFSKTITAQQAEVDKLTQTIKTELSVIRSQSKGAKSQQAAVDTLLGSPEALRLKEIQAGAGKMAAATGGVDLRTSATAALSAITVTTDSLVKAYQEQQEKVRDEQIKSLKLESRSIIQKIKAAKNPAAAKEAEQDLQGVIAEYKIAALEQIQQDARTEFESDPKLESQAAKDYIIKAKAALDIEADSMIAKGVKGLQMLDDKINKLIQKGINAKIDRLELEIASKSAALANADPESAAKIAAELKPLETQLVDSMIEKLKNEFQDSQYEDASPETKQAILESKKLLEMKIANLISASFNQALESEKMRSKSQFDLGLTKLEGDKGGLIAKATSLKVGGTHPKAGDPVAMKATDDALIVKNREILALKAAAVGAEIKINQEALKTLELSEQTTLLDLAATTNAEKRAGLAQTINNITADENRIVAENKKLTAEKLALELKLANIPAPKESKGVFGDAIEKKMKELENSTTMFNLIENAADNLFDSLNQNVENWIQNWAKGTASVKDLFRGFAESVLDTAMKMMAKLVASKFMKLIGSFLINSVGGTDTSFKFQAAGGPVVGGIPNRDSVPTMLMPGEYVMRKSAVDAVGRDTLDSLNADGNKSVSKSSSAISGSVTAAKAGGNQVVNVWAVQQDQVPPPGPRDIIATIADDIISGGSTKKLIKSVQMGVM